MTLRIVYAILACWRAKFKRLQFSLRRQVLLSVLILGYIYRVFQIKYVKYDLDNNVVSNENSGCVFTLACMFKVDFSKTYLINLVLKIAFRSLHFESSLGEDTPDPLYKARASGANENASLHCTKKWPFRPV